MMRMQAYMCNMHTLFILTLLPVCLCHNDEKGGRQLDNLEDDTASLDNSKQLINTTLHQANSTVHSDCQTGQCLNCPQIEPPVPFSQESRLINCLLERYAHVSTLARPVRDSSSNVIVHFGVSLIQILDFDEIKQVLTTSIWKNYIWTDHVLRWDPAYFGGVTHIRLPASRIWTPDIVLYNNADEQVKQHEELAAVFFNGTVKWIPPAIYRSSCEIDMKNFPFDKQSCFLKFGSWTYDQHKVDLRLYQNANTVDLREYVQSSEWEIDNTSAFRHIRQYPFFDTDPYPEVIFTLKLRRQSTFYIYLLVLPCVLLSSLTLVLFWIPPQRPDRTAVGMSLFSSFFILLLILVQSSPPTSASISRLGINYCVNMVLIALSTILSVVVINIGQMGTHASMPTWLSKRRLDVVASALCIKTPKFSEMLNSGNQSRESKENGIYLESLNPPTTRVQVNNVPTRDTLLRWHTLAAILDRIFFFMYLLAILFSTAFIFPR